MERRIVYRGEYDYIVEEDGRVFLPAREFTFMRRGKEVTSSKPARESKYQIMNNGYKKCSLGLVHRVVAEAFIGEPAHPKYTVNHKDGDKLNNHYTNLEWISHKDNVRHWIYSQRGLGSKLHPIEVWTVEGELVGVYPYKQLAAKELGIHKSSITMVIKGKIKSSAGYTFKMITKEEYYAKTNTR